MCIFLGAGKFSLNLKNERQWHRNEYTADLSFWASPPWPDIVMGHQVFCQGVKSFGTSRQWVLLLLCSCCTLENLGVFLAENLVIYSSSGRPSLLDTTHQRLYKQSILTHPLDTCFQKCGLQWEWVHACTLLIKRNCLVKKKKCGLWTSNT
jgi:hypothetical protein